VYHWVGAASIGLAAYITQLSNFAGKGSAAVGSFAGLTMAGAYDMAGNAREWCATAVAGTNDRYILGGSWADPAYAMTHANAGPPFDRSEQNGFRLATYLDKAPLAVVFTDPVAVSKRDFNAEQPVSDQVFSAYRALFAYDPRPLDAKVEARDESQPDWIKERVSFRAAYRNERVPAYVFLPKNSRPPYQGIVYAPGAAALLAGSSANLRDTVPFDYAVVSGRAVIYPIYQGTYERNTGQTSTWPQKTRAYQEWMVEMLNDARRAVDYLESRSDIRRDDLAYLSTSWGSALGARLLAQEPRFKTAILLDGGFTQETQVLPELDALNYVSRVTLPTLMINGNSDLIFPLELGQKPYFARLGTPPEHKRHVVLTGGHFIIGQQRSQVVREVLDWLDRYLGPVER
jgi:dienelactone hydrolase